VSATTTADVRQAGVRRVLWITLGLNVIVSGSKIVVGTLSSSLSMVADGYHSLLDGTNNVVGLIVTAFAYAPADEGHPYGHRKFETSATVAIGMTLLALAYRVVEGAFSHLSHGKLPEISALNWAVMAVTLGVNLFVSWYETRAGQRLGSEYLVADATHTRSDIYVSLGVVASFAGARAGLPWVDAVIATGIAAFIAVLAVRILVSSFHVLTDRAVIPPETIAKVVLGVPGVVAYRDIRTRGGPGSVYVDLVVHVDGDVTLRAAHDVADRIEAAIAKALPEVVDVVVHLEPAPR
jgi:cation diffusion facilitator family transporter